MTLDEVRDGMDVTTEGPCGTCYGTVKVVGTESEPIAVVIWDVGSELPDGPFDCKPYEKPETKEVELPLAA